MQPLIPSDNQPLTPMTEKEVVFEGDRILAVGLEKDGLLEIYVPMRPICDALGLSWAGQYERLQRDPVLSTMIQGVRVTRTPGGSGVRVTRTPDGGTQEMLCLPLEYLNGWLFGVNVNRIKPHLREKVIRYQKECYRILYEAFQGVASAAPIPPGVGEAHLLAMRELARQQATLAQQNAEIWDALVHEKRRLDAVQQLAEEHEGMLQDLIVRVDHLQQGLGDVQEEMTHHIEALTSRTAPRLPPPTTIDPAQKAAIKALVDDLVAAAQARGMRLGQGRNDYPAAWDAFKRRFDLAKYDELPASRFDEACGWLKEWLGRVRG